MYALEELLQWFSERTIAKWRERNPRLVRQPATKRAFVLSDDLFELFSTWDDL